MKTLKFDVAMNKNAIINPVSGKKSPQLGPYGIMAATLPDIHRLCDNLGYDRNWYTDTLGSRLYHKNDGSGICVAGPFIGAPHAVMILENLIAWGVREIIFTGWCGAISPKVQTGDIILPDGAFPDEGTSKHYGASGEEGAIKPTAILYEKVASQFREKEIPFHTGKIWSTDAIYRETPDRLLHFREKGALAVEMEASAIFSAARFRNIEAISIMTVSDELSSLTWQPGFGDKRFKKARNTVIDVASEIWKDKKSIC